MSSFSDKNFVKKLGELNNTQQSIQTLSLWLIHHRKHSKTIVEVWLREINRVRPNTKLTFMYLANDVIQNSKKKGPEFTKDFASVLPDAYNVVVGSVDEKICKSVERILNIWQERGVYSANFINQIKSGSGNTLPLSEIAPKLHRKRKSVEEYVVTKKKAPPKGYQSLTLEQAPPPTKKKKKDENLSLREEIDQMPSDSNPTVDAEELVKRLSDLEHSASSDAAVREKIAALPPEVSDINHLSKITDRETANKLFRQVEDACILLSEYNFRLNAELEERKMVGKMLRDFLTIQKDQVQKTEKDLNETRSRLEKVSVVRQKVMSHIQNLPDLSALPNMAPLPAAGDLFSA
ncbi:hypothetical protein FSP39_018457 [Pinctada imbricata]|uniref:CID domain-containing protein n=1 Tax=Pinctada imbricata TaxID=66713 RepID=A0AA89BPL1_PINIB|nr:hypothetical protein FSP39_018457 [Pinctada imbricata]